MAGAWRNADDQCKLHFAPLCKVAHASGAGHCLRDVLLQLDAIRLRREFMKVQQATAPVAPPAPAPGPTQPAVAGGTPGVPNPQGQTLAEMLGRQPTRADLRDLEKRGESLSTQLLSAQGRREEIVKELKTTTDPVVRKGLEQRLNVLDNRLANLELEIAANSRMRAAVPGNLLQETTEAPRPEMGSPIPNLSQGGFIAISIVFTIFVLSPIAVAYARRLWRKPVAPIPSAQLQAQNDRMERMEQAIDAVAIEVERISEGQRFVTQLLSKTEAPALSVGRGMNA